MRVAFLGSSEFGAIGLEAVAGSAHPVVLAVTSCDKPKGRGQCCEPGPVSLVAEKHGIPMIQPSSIKEPSAMQALLETKPDIIVVVCYGEYIPQSIFNAPPSRSINVHPSLLPRWRGASPVHYALLAGDEMTGVTVQYVHKKMDAGDILLQKEVPVEPDEDHGHLSERLYRLAGTMLVEALDGLEKGELTPRPQDESLVTKAPKIEKADLRLKWDVSAREVRNRIRAFAPSPGAKSNFRGTLCKMLSAGRDSVNLDAPFEPGTIVSIGKDGPVVACMDFGLMITGIQPAGKRALSGRDFINGYRPRTGEKFESISGEGTI